MTPSELLGPVVRASNPPRKRIGEELTVTAPDKCDGANVTVKIVDVRSEEAMAAVGSGNATEPDAVHGDHAACVRAERSGLGDAGTTPSLCGPGSGNATRKTMRIVVPYDASGYTDCVRAIGLSILDERCRG